MTKRPKVTPPNIKKSNRITDEERELMHTDRDAFHQVLRDRRPKDN